MVGGRKPYQKGYRFEARVMDKLRARGYVVFRQHGSAFPDLIALPDLSMDTIEIYGAGTKQVLGKVMLPRHKMFIQLGKSAGLPLIIECKVGKYLSSKEKEELARLSKNAFVLVAYPEPNPDNARYVDIVFAKPDNYEEVLRL